MAQSTQPQTELPVPREKMPRHVAIIMDGNGRWARSRSMPVGAGHRAGARALKNVVRHASDMGVRFLTVYSFSTENWRRPQEEVDELMDLFVDLIDREVPELLEERVRMRFIGRREVLKPELRERIARSEAQTAHCTGLNLFIAMNYGGRQEILDAAGRLAAEGYDPYHTGPSRLGPSRPGPVLRSGRERGRVLDLRLRCDLGVGGPPQDPLTQPDRPGRA